MFSRFPILLQLAELTGKYSQSMLGPYFCVTSMFQFRVNIWYPSVGGGWLSFASVLLC